MKTKTMKLKVTQRDIDLANKYKADRQADKPGAKQVSHSCPIACAIRRVTHHATSVGTCTATIYVNGGGRSFNVDETGRKFIHAFDTDANPGPVTVELTAY